MKRRRWASIAGGWVGVLVAVAVWAPAMARQFAWQPLPPQEVAALSPEARTLYQKAVQQLDRVNYRAAMDYLNQAVQAAPDSMPLRYLAILLARYLGDTTSNSPRYPGDSSPTSVQYYDMAIAHLQAMIDSPRLNAREKQRAQQSLDDVMALRRTVTERDERRRAWGQSFAKIYAQEHFPKTPEEQAKEQEATARRQALASGQFVLPTPDMLTAPAATGTLGNMSLGDALRNAADTLRPAAGAGAAGALAAGAEALGNVLTGQPGARAGAAATTATQTIVPPTPAVPTTGTQPLLAPAGGAVPAVVPPPPVPIEPAAGTLVPVEQPVTPVGETAPTTQTLPND